MILSSLHLKLKQWLTARRVFLLLMALSLFLGLVTRQWLRRNTLENPPSYDALVYQNQSYDDLVLVEQSGWAGYFRKYANGTSHVPPLYMGLGTLSYLILGLDPANAYLVNIPFFFLFGWSSYLLFRFARAGTTLSLVCTLLVSLAPSTAAYALRHFMTDFAAASIYLFATAMLMHSQRLRKRKAAAWFGIGLAFSLLIKSSLLIYYLPQILLVAYWLFRERSQRTKRWVNTGMAVGLVAGLAGWFYFFNLPQILRYYLGWAGSRSSVTKTAAGIANTSDSLLYYIRNVARFHFEGVGARSIWGVIALILLLGLLLRLRSRSGGQNHRTAALALLLGGQYLVLTAYPSKVNVVDFSLIPFYFLIPVSWLFAPCERGRRRSWEKRLAAALLVVLTAVSVERTVALVLQAAPLDKRQDWKVKAVLAAIFEHADKLGYREIVVGSTPVHPYYTCENLRFYAVSGALPNWRSDRFSIPAIGSAGNAEALYAYIEKSDYVVAIEGWQGPEQIPNNHWAPTVNQWLAAGRGGFSLLFEQPVPLDSKVRVYFRREHLSHDTPQPDGWATAGFRFFVTSSRPSVRIHVSGRLPLPPTLPYPAHILLTDDQGQAASDPIVISDGKMFEGFFSVVLRPDWQGRAILKLASDREFSPFEHGGSPDHRRLLVRLDRIRLE